MPTDSKLASGKLKKDTVAGEFRNPKDNKNGGRNRTSKSAEN